MSFRKDQIPLRQQICILRSVIELTNDSLGYSNGAAIDATICNLQMTRCRLAARQNYIEAISTHANVYTQAYVLLQLLKTESAYV